MSADLDKMEALLEQGAEAEGQLPGFPPPEWCKAQLSSMREWRGHYDVTPAAGTRDYGQLTMLVRFAMPLKATT